MLISKPNFFNAGIGNIIIPLAKAYLASKALNCPLLIPFNLDTRRMKIYFNPIKMGYFPYVPNPLKKITFTYDDFNEISKVTNTIDYYENIKYFVKNYNYKNGILISEGMWGGYFAIYRAKKWIKAFLASSIVAKKNIGETSLIFDAMKIQVALHIRRGDFATDKSNILKNNLATKWNIRIPIEWYHYVAEQLVIKFGKNNIEFILFSDSYSDTDIINFIQKYQVLVPKRAKKKEFSDLFLMSESDFLVCANSSFSMLAAFLSESPYLMYSGFIGKKDCNYILWDEEIYKYNCAIDGTNPRGFLINIGESLNERLTNMLTDKLNEKNSLNSELIFGGKLLR